MILLFAEIMRSAFTGKETFTGHIGGDDFFLGLSMPPDTVAEIAGDVRELMENFAYSAGTLYSDDEAKNGCYRARNRNGEDACFPLLTVSAAILGLKGGNGEVTLDSINCILAKLKKESKCSDSRMIVHIINGVESKV